MPRMIVGVVLAAGASTRLGRPKQTLPFGDTTVLGRVVADAERSSLDRVVVVVDPELATQVPELDHGRSVHVAPGTRSDGCSGSLHAGLSEAGECEAVMVLLGDMPGVDPAVIDAVAADWRRGRPWAMVTRYRDGLGHPFVFAETAFPELLALHGDKAVWKLLDRYPDRIERSSQPRRRPADIDTDADYRSALEAFGLAE
jgi:molybdenum cofactor cytidylyltransferase